MRKMGIAVLAGAFVLVSVASGYAGPATGGKNFNIRSREITQNRIDSVDRLYARHGAPRDVSSWKWRPVKRSWRSYRAGVPSPMLKRVPAS